MSADLLDLVLKVFPAPVLGVPLALVLRIHIARIAAGLQRAEEIDGMIRRIAEEQRDRPAVRVPRLVRERGEVDGGTIAFGIAYMVRLAAERVTQQTHYHKKTEMKGVPQ